MKAIIDKVALIEEKLDSDIVFFNGDIEERSCQQFIRLFRSLRKRPNVLLVLVTRGGSPDSGYRIARFLQNQCSHFRLFIPSRCKSTGTLIALGATEIIMSDTGELGPLDIQLSKLDELGELSSGLNIMQALTTLNSQSFQALEQYVLNLKAYRSITLKTCLEVATNLTQGLYGNLYRQIDPVYVGEVGRSMRIAEYYGEKLNRQSQNLKEDTLIRLIAGYPSHNYVIDRGEAEELFKKVYPPSDELSEVETLLRDVWGFIGDLPLHGEKSLVFFVKDFLEKWHNSLDLPGETADDKAEEHDKSEDRASPEGAEHSDGSARRPPQSDITVEREVISASNRRKTEAAPSETPNQSSQDGDGIKGTSPEH